MKTFSNAVGATERRQAIRFRVAALLAVALLAAPLDAALAHGFKLGALEIEHPWSRATPPGAKVGGGYLTLVNAGDADDRLVAVTFAGSERAEIHQMAVTDGVMSMRPVEGGLAIPAHSTVALEPSGLHLMFVGLKQPLVQGTEVKGTLTFEKAGTVEVEFAVEAIGAKAAAHDDDGGMSGMKMP